jgi:hypothetical protein
MIRAPHARSYAAHMISTSLISSGSFRQSDGESARRGFSAERTRSNAHVTIQGNSWWLACLSSPFLSLIPPPIAPYSQRRGFRVQTNFAQRLVEREGEMAQDRQREPFEMPFTFSFNNFSSLVADHRSKKSTFGDLLFPLPLNWLFSALIRNVCCFRHSLPCPRPPIRSRFRKNSDCGKR